METNQDEPRDVGAGALPDPEPPSAFRAAEPQLATDAPQPREEAQARAAAVHAAETVAGTARRGLLRWTVFVFAGALVGLVFGRPDVALFLSVAAMFALAQSWDVRDRARTGDPWSDAALEPGDVGRALRLVVPLLAPMAGAAGYALLAVYARSLPPTAASVAAMQWCIAAGAVSLLLAFRPVAQLVANAFMRGTPPAFTTRLTASIALVLLLLPVPMRLLSDQLMSELKNSGRPLADIGGLVAQLACEVVFALAAVGLWVARDLRAVRDRLGLGRMGAREWLVAAVGLAAVIGVNAGMEWLERERFHELWLADQAMGRLITLNLSLVGALVLGVSAGVGEELLVRGALQPRTGLLWASILFAAGHVQYTWFGMFTILLLGLALGLVRNRANTTTAIVVHVLYDIFAVLATPS